MDNCWGRSGVFGLVFAALLLVFNWPLMSIPDPAHLLGWLLAAWIAGIALLALAARATASACRTPQDAEAEGAPRPGQSDGQPDGQPGEQSGGTANGADDV